MLLLTKRTFYFFLMSYYDPHRIGLRNQSYKYSKRGQVIQKKLSDSPPDLMHVRDIDKETWYAYLKNIDYKGLGSYDPSTSLATFPLRGFRSGETLDDYIEDLGSRYEYVQIYCNGLSIGSTVQICQVTVPGNTYPLILQPSTPCIVSFFSIDDVVFFQVTTGRNGGLTINGFSDLSSIGDSYTEMLDTFKTYIQTRGSSFIGYLKSPYGL